MLPGQCLADSNCRRSVKNGGLGVNALTVFGNSLLGGSTGSNAYLNYGATAGTNGYGIRDNAGTLEFKNSGGSWASIQSTVFNLVGWTSSGNNIHNTNTGNVGIGTASPAARLEVTGGTQLTAQGWSNSFQTDTIVFPLSTRGGANHYFFIGAPSSDGNGDMFFGQTGQKGAAGSARYSAMIDGTSNQWTFLSQSSGVSSMAGLNQGNGVYGLIGLYSYSFYGNGNSYVAGASYAAAFQPNSDARLKQNIRTSPGLDIVSKLRGVLFDWKKDGTPSAGVIAQEVEAVFPEVVSIGPNGFKTVNYDALIAPLIESVKELAIKFDGLTDRMQNNELCVGDTCVTPEQFKAMVEASKFGPTVEPMHASSSATPATKTTTQ